METLAAAAEERRNPLVHRPPVLVMGGHSHARYVGGTAEPETEVINTQALEMLPELDSVWRASFDVLAASWPTE